MNFHGCGEGDGRKERHIPSSIMELQHFLGFANFYRRFIMDFSFIVTPLHSSLGTGHPGANTILSLIQQRFLWSGIAADVRQFVKSVPFWKVIVICLETFTS